MASQINIPLHFIVVKANIKSMNEAPEAQKELQELIALIKKLRSPAGCPWDRKQKPQAIGKYVLDEAYEVVDTLETKDWQALKEELGDLLFQILFLAEMEAELKKQKEEIINKLEDLDFSNIIRDGTNRPAFQTEVKIKNKIIEELKNQSQEDKK